MHPTQTFLFSSVVVAVLESLGRGYAPKDCPQLSIFLFVVVGQWFRHSCYCCCHPLNVAHVCSCCCCLTMRRRLE